ncbi:hypothetical protein [Streptomyces sp. H27-D2]|uniref:hypothetical protein n=1 Tax=Streptomyces sp. H27-D2 TaxID=3046304 RepID=UPI002DBE6563|nr:hypothetical protein [Streptomyces sp. H27-D2]MEC4020405.1 hypothetical protein [Streptomyces sp. H27-D2]
MSVDADGTAVLSPHSAAALTRYWPDAPVEYRFGDLPELARRTADLRERLRRLPVPVTASGPPPRRN